MACAPVFFKKDPTMLQCRVVFFAIVCGCGVCWAAIDSSSIIFDDTKIHAYDLQFYYPDWLDSLEYYKSFPDEEYIPARFVYRMSAADSMVLDSVGVRYKGNSSYNFAKNSPKKPLKFSFDKYRKGRRFFGIERLNFGNGAKDPTMMREKISYDILGRYMPAPRAAFATICIEGKLIGLYTQVEQVDKVFLGRYFSDNNGNLYKSSDNGSTLLYKGPNQSSYEADYELKTNVTLNDWSAFIGMIDKLNNTPVADFVNVLSGRLNMDYACRYLAFNMVFANFDSYTGSGRNFYFYDDPASLQCTIIPWDLNLSFGVYTNNWNVTTVDIVAISNLAQRPLNKRVLENDSLRRVYLSYIGAMLDGPASRDSIAALADRLKPLIDSTVQADSNTLHTYDDFVNNIESDVTVMDGLSRTTIPGLKSFISKRSDAVRIQLAKYLPVAERNGGATTRVPILRCCPSPSGSALMIRYGVANWNASARIDVFNGDGAPVASFLERTKRPGVYEIRWNTVAAAAGCYMVRMNTLRGTATAAAMVVR
jgi:hypothetical protein